VERSVISEVAGGHSVIKIANEAIIKCGPNVTQQEAENQRIAFELIDQTIIRVPRVYRYVASSTVGYLVMEFIDGEPLQTFEDAHVCATITRTLTNFAQIQSDQPGPLGVGTAHGMLWSASDSFSLLSTADIETYYNTKQLEQHTKLRLEGFSLILCHLDLVPRNVLKLQDRSLCLLDWASAGFYPRFFEICTLRINCGNSKLLRSCYMNSNEAAQEKVLEHAYYLGEKYTQ
jgi:fructosamine-3-kinase